MINRVKCEFGHRHSSSTMQRHCNAEIACASRYQGTSMIPGHDQLLQTVSAQYCTDSPPPQTLWQGTPNLWTGPHSSRILSPLPSLPLPLQCPWCTLLLTLPFLSSQTLPSTMGKLFSDNRKDSFGILWPSTPQNYHLPNRITPPLTENC